MSEDMMAQLAASLNGHQVTDEEGNITEESETPVQASAPENQTTEEESAPVETPPAQNQEDAKPQETEEETLAEDESGKKYVPQSRFDKIYGKMKANERELAEFKARIAQGEALLQNKGTKPVKQPEIKIDKADVLELKMALPQFNPDSDQYDSELDQWGFEILRANPGITPLQAGRQALQRAAKLTKRIVEAKTEARSVKVQQSDSGITNRVVSRAGAQPDFNSMSDKEMEAWLKQNGQW